MNAGEREIMAAKGGLQIVKELGLPKKKKKILETGLFIGGDGCFY